MPAKPISIALGGKSQRAFELAAKHACCLLTMPDPPDELYGKIKDLLSEVRTIVKHPWPPQNKVRRGNFDKTLTNVL